MTQHSISKLVAPLSGLVLTLDQVPDPVFAQRLVGQGLAIDPTSQVLVSPLSGQVVQLHRAHHAVTVRGDDGLEVLMHIGIDTVKLGGEGFRPKVQVGDRVRAGQALVEFDADLIAQRAKSLITIVIITDVEADRLRPTPQSRVQAGKDVVCEVTPAGGAAKVASNAGASAESKDITITLPTGLHARPAALLVGLAKTFTSTIQLRKGDQSANAKSVVGIMSLEIGHADVVRFMAKGEDADAAVTKLQNFLEQLEEAPPDHPPAESGAKPTAARVSTDANVILGVGVSPGLAIGRVHQIRAEELDVRERSTRSVAEERAALEQALVDGKQALQNLLTQVKSQTGAGRAAIFAAHQELLEDPDIVYLAQAMIDKGKSAAFAWDQAITSHADRLSKLNNELMANRANDLRDVGRRVLRLLVVPGDAQPKARPTPPDSILIAENLTPSETVQLDREKVLGFCTTTGGATSHVAILARSLGLPAIAGIDAKVLDLADGAEVILDGDKGELRLNPSEDLKAKARATQAKHAEHREDALKLAHEAARTKDDHAVEVAANIGSVADARKAVEMGCDGVGLLRSEFLFLERETAPSEEEQHKVYQQIADVLGSRTLVIRTLDVGGDKPLKYLPIEAEENPFLGIRGIRVGFIHPEILRQQLRAILRVKTKGKLCVMFPMISTLEEFRKARVMLEEEREALKAPPVEVGIMVEVPSVAMIAEAFAKEVDFFSVGTNDLTQYTLAMDRGHKGLAKQVDALHPSVLAMIDLAVQAAHRHGKWVGVCGGLASDLKAVPILLGLGVDELSVSIPTIPLVKAEVREATLARAKDLARRAVVADTATKVRELTP